MMLMFLTVTVAEMGDPLSQVMEYAVVDVGVTVCDPEAPLLLVMTDPFAFNVHDAA